MSMDDPERFVASRLEDMSNTPTSPKRSILDHQLSEEIPLCAYSPRLRCELAQRIKKDNVTYNEDSYYRSEDITYGDITRYFKTPNQFIRSIHHIRNLGRKTVVAVVEHFRDKGVFTAAEWELPEIYFRRYKKEIEEYNQRKSNMDNLTESNFEI